MSEEKVVISDLTDRELEVAWHAICAFAEWTYEFPFPAKVEGSGEDARQADKASAVTQRSGDDVIADEARFMWQLITKAGWSSLLRAVVVA